ncbi:GEVED domain-containing protein [Flavobacterium azooxidireducens]|uniref:GEVED domain-containing protein n=1 Tax=Flavobacterium azooxidireducens TaxID=1871076 RepID=A0ABY4KLW8_9FLAO|nr:GEVED domain-containing protein [Flavobacterium azooxidireducens]UPQ80773.1 GEVED domain-containing protein [Flavobacterium azooxidireducens]
MTKYYNSLSWRLGTSLKTREPDGDKNPYVSSFFATKKVWHLMFLFLILNIFSLDSFAQITVGAGNTSNGNGPFSSCWGYSYHQQIYLQPTINTAGNITSLSFTSAGIIPTTATGGTPNTPQGANTAFRIYLGHTTKADFATNNDWEPLANLTLVYDGSVTMPTSSGQVITINLTVPFAYNNTDNLILAVDENSPGYSCTYNWLANTAQTNRNIYFRSDTINPDPTAPGTGARTTTTPQVVLGGLVPVLPPNCIASPTTPSNAGTGFNGSNLTWSGATGNPSGYTLYFGTDGGGTLAPTNLVNGSALGLTNTYAIPPGTLSPSTTYYWQVIPTNNNGAATGCAIWSFTTANLPNCVTTQTPANLATNVALNTALSWSSVAGASSYDVFLGTSSPAAFYANATGTSTPLVATLLANTEYFYKIVPKNALGSATSCVEGSFTTGSSFIYCNPTYSLGCGTDAITNVVLGSLSNASGCTASPHYTFYNALTVPTLQRGVNQNISISFGTDSNQYSAVWVDFNQNGTFEASEGFLATGNAGASGTAVITINVPLGAVLGNTRLRVRGGDDSPLTTSMACGASASSYGETEDYIVTITEAPVCLPPTAFTANVLGDSVNLNWSSTGSDFQIEYGLSGFTLGTGTTVLASGISTTIEELTLEQAYQTYIRQDCGVDGFSSWVGPITFTPSNSVTNTSGNISTLLVAVEPTPSTFSTCPGTLSITVPTGKWIASLAVEYSMTAVGDLFDEGWMSEQRSFIYSPTLGVGEATVAAGAGDSTGTFNYSRNLPFAEQATGTITFQLHAFRGYGGSGCGTTFNLVNNGTWKLTPVFEDIPSCFAVSASSIVVVPSAVDSASITWNAPSSPPAVGYEWAMTTSATPPTSGTFTATTSAEAGSLAIGTSYYVHVRGVCEEGVDYSAWRTSAIYNTPCISTTVPYFMGFEVAENTSCLLYQDLNGVSTWNVFTGTSTSASTGTNSMQYQWNASVPGNDWFFLQGLTLDANANYRFKFKYKASDGPTYVENLEVKYGTLPTASEMTSGTLATLTGINSALASPFSEFTIDFSPATTGVYYIGFHNFSAADNAFLYIDDISVDFVPPVFTSFEPATACSDDLNETTITITGSNLSDISEIEINGSSYPFTVVNDTTITVDLDENVTTGVITISDGFSTVNSATLFEVFNSPDVDPITAPDTALCMPNTLLLTSTSGGSWSSSDETIATVVGGTVSGVSPGTVTISYSITDNGCTTTVTYDVTINAPVVINSFTPSQTVVTGNNATFSVTASGTGLTYQWFAFDGIDTYQLDDLLSLYGESYTGSTTSSLVIGSVPGDMNGFEFYCEVSGVSPCTPETTTPNSILNVGDTGISSDPVNAALCDGGSTTFTVVRSGDDAEEDITYSWEYDADGTENWLPVTDGDLDGMTISDAETNVLSVSTITLVHDGYRFRGVVTGPANAATSNPATLTVNEGVSISDQPDSTLVCRINTTANFSVATGGVVSGIQWQSSPNGVDTWTNVGTGASLSVNVTPASSVGVTYYRAVVSGTSPCLPLNSDVVTLTVQQPTISVTPSSASYCVPSDPVSLTASGAATYTWSPATGLSATTGDTVLASPASTTTYTVTGVDADGCSNTTTVTVTVNNAVLATATATPDTVCPEANVQLDVTPTQGSKNISAYKFTRTTSTYSALTGATTFSISAGAGTADDGYSALLGIGFNFNFGGNNFTQFRVSSNGAVYLGGAPAATSYAALGADSNVIAFNSRDLNNSGAVYSYVVDGVAPNRILKIQATNFYRYNTPAHTGNAQVWLHETSNLVEIRYGAYNQAWTSAGVQVGLRGTSSAATQIRSISSTTWAAITDASASTSSSATITQGTTNQVVSGTLFRFTPDYSDQFTYSWTSEPAGFTSSVKNPIANPTEDTTYTVTVTGASGCSTTSEVAVSVISGAEIETQPVSLVQCAGTNATFTVEASGPGITYQWRKGGASIDGATSATLQLNNISASDDASYDVVVTPLCGEPVTSDAVTLTVNPLPTAVATNNGPVCEGGTVNLTGSSDVGVTFSWTGPNGFTSTDQNPTISDVTLAASGTYTFTATSADNCSSTGSTEVLISPSLVLAITPSANPINVCEGDLQQLTVSTSTTSVILTENFNGAASGWTTQNLTTGGSNQAATAWTLRPSPYTIAGTFGATLSSNDTSQFMLTDSDIGGSGSVTDTRLQSPAFSTVGYNSVNISFYHYYRIPATFAGLEYSLNGTTWTTLKTYTTVQGAPTGFVQDNIVLPAAALNQAVVYVRFRYDATWQYYWAVDNFVVSGTPIPNVTWSPATDLYTDASGTISYTGGNAATVYARISTTSPTSYTATAVSSFGCESEAIVSLSVTPATTWYADTDGDGFGNDAVTLQACTQPVGYVAVGGDCNDNANTIYPGATEICYDGILQNCNGDLNDGCPVVLTQIRPYFCGTTLQFVNSSILADTPTGLPVGATITGYRYEITNLSTTAVREVEKTIAMIRINETDIAGFNTAYSIRVMVRINNEWQDYGTACTILTPAIPTTAVSTVCGQVLPSLQSTIYATTVVSSTGYEFEVSRMEGGVAVETTTIERSVNNFKLTLLSGIQYVYASEYQVRVRVKANVNGIEGWSNYGAVCSVYTPEAPEAAIDGCGGEEGIAPAALNTPIYATPLTGATQYRFTLSDGVSYNQVYTTSARFFRLSNFNALQTLTPGGNYSVTVEAEIYGYFYPGKDCNILVPGGGLRSNLVKTEETINLPTDFKAVAYPNPFANSFAVDVRTSNTEKVSLTVYDMAGRLLEVKEVNASEVANYQFGDRYPSGVYNMIVTQGEETRTVRVVKQ